MQTPEEKDSIITIIVTVFAVIVIIVLAFLFYYYAIKARSLAKTEVAFELSDVGGLAALSCFNKR